MLVTHFINRMVTALLDEEALLPSALRRSAYVRRAAALSVGPAARRNPEPGAGLAVLDGSLPDGPAPAWAGPGSVGPAYLALRAAASAGGGLLGEAARAAVLAAVAGWDGSHPPLAGDPTALPLADVPSEQRPGARLALLAALAPYRITDADVAAWRADRDGNGSRDGDGSGGASDDRGLTRLLAFGAITATVRVEAWITAGARSTPAA
ncbi:hypothetical protein ACFQ0M_36525 [Kitasatospora aburaviensis]